MRRDLAGHGRLSRFGIEISPKRRGGGDRARRGRFLGGHPGGAVPAHTRDVQVGRGGDGWTTTAMPEGNGVGGVEAIVHRPPSDGGGMSGRTWKKEDERERWDGLPWTGPKDNLPPSEEMHPSGNAPAVTVDGLE